MSDHGDYTIRRAPALPVLCDERTFGTPSYEAPRELQPRICSQICWQTYVHTVVPPYPGVQSGTLRRELDARAGSASRAADPGVGSGAAGGRRIRARREHKGRRSLREVKELEIAGLWRVDRAPATQRHGHGDGGRGAASNLLRGRRTEDGRPLFDDLYRECHLRADSATPKTRISTRLCVVGTSRLPKVRC